MKAIAVHEPIGSLQKSICSGSARSEMFIEEASKKEISWGSCRSAATAPAKVPIAYEAIYIAFLTELNSDDPSIMCLR